MDDAIGEVLAQRKALDRGAGAGIAFSVIVHGAITAAAVYAALRTPVQQNVPVIEIKFAKMPAPVAAPPAPTPAAPPQPTPQPIVPAPKPVATPPAKTVPLSPFGKSPKKGTEHPETARPRDPATPAPEIPVGGTGAVVEGDFPYTIYIERMRTLIGQHWYRPQAAPGIATTVYFVIERDGTVRDARSESESGNGTFDRAALRAILESSPLPPLPFGYSGTYLGVHLTFK
ncbi:MAG: energy transducer TonB [Acidobacteriota bacterium]